MKWNVEINKIKTMTASDWSAYSSMTGVGAANTRVRNSFFNAIKWGRKKIETDSLVDEIKVGQECFKRVKKVMRNVSDFGFTDTEPQCILCEYIEEYLDLPSNTIERW